MLSLTLGLSRGDTGLPVPSPTAPLTISGHPTGFFEMPYPQTADFVQVTIADDDAFNGVYSLALSDLESGAVCALGPLVTGAPEVGQVLTASGSLWFARGELPPEVSGIWLRDGAPIDGEAGPSLMLVDAYRDGHISYRETVGEVTETSDPIMFPPALEILSLNGTPRITGLTGTEVELTFDPPSRVAGTHVVPLSALANGPYPIGPLAWEAGDFAEGETISLSRPVWIGDAAHGPLSFAFATTGSGTVSETDFATLTYQTAGGDGGTSVLVTETATNQGGLVSVSSASLAIGNPIVFEPSMALLAPTERLLSAQNASTLTASPVDLPPGTGNGLLVVALNWSADTTAGTPTLSVDYGSGVLLANPHFDSFQEPGAFEATGTVFYTASVPYGTTVTCTAAMPNGSVFTSNARMTYWMGAGEVTGGFAIKAFSANFAETLHIPAGSTLFAVSTAYGNTRSVSFPNANLESIYQDDNWHSAAVAWRSNQPQQPDGSINVATVGSHHIAVSALIVEHA